MTGVTRRSAIAAAGNVAGIAALVTAGAVGTARGSIESSATPDHVTITYDEARLERWQPYLSLDIEADNDLSGVYGYVATSDQWDRDVLCYWSRYAVQEGWLPWDTHQYDHEPVYLFLDAAASEPAPPDALELVKYAAYHHYSGSWEPTTEDLEGSRQSDAETHVSLDVVSPWHHYRRGEAGSGLLPDLRDWPSARPEWEAYGFYDDTSREAVDNPITMYDREHWWRDGTVDARVASLWLRLGLDPDARDDLDREA